MFYLSGRSVLVSVLISAVFSAAAFAEQNLSLEIQRRIAVHEAAQRRAQARADAARTNPPLPTPAVPPPDLPPGLPPGPAAELVLDLNAGGSSQTAQQKIAAFSFALNSINTTQPGLFRVDEALRDAFPPKGAIPAAGPARVRVPLNRFLSATQIQAVRNAIDRDPLVCSPTEQRDGLRPDVFVRNVLGTAAYYNVMGLNNTRADFERQMGITSEFGPSTEIRDTGKNTTRVVLEPGESGVAHPEGYRGLILQTQRGGGLVARTKDFDRENATKDRAHLQAFPVSATADASEEIWELPNGFRGYALRAANGTLQTSAPVTVVHPRIVNPVSCMRCHSTGFIATTGKGGSTPLSGLTPVRVADEAGQGRAQFSASFQDYQDRITASNIQYQSVLRQSGAMTGKELSTFMDNATADVSAADLAAELGTTVAQLRDTIRGDQNLRRALNGPAWAGNDPSAYPSLPRASLERSVALAGSDVRSSAFCALKNRIVEEARLRGRPRDLASGDPHGGLPRSEVTTH